MAFKYSAPQHLNGNLFCAVDVETTGLDPERHSILDICILPLNGDYTPNKSILPFNCKMQPLPGREIDDEAMQVNRLDLAWIMQNALDAYRVLDLLVEWFEKMCLPLHKNIIPIAHNWPFDRSFILNWMGVQTYQMIFNREYRDTFTTSCMLNDRADIMSERIPYPKRNLQYLAQQHSIVNPAPHEALGDCLTTAELYRHLLLGFRG